MEDLADDASGLLTGLGIRKAHVLGASMGGNVAQELTLRHPDQVSTLTLMSTYMSRPERSSVGIDAMINTVREGASIETFLTMMQAWCLTNAAFRGRENVAQNDKRGARERDLLMVDGFARQKAALDNFDTHERVSAIKVPTLVIHGNEDIMVPYRFGEELASRIGGLEAGTAGRLWAHDRAGPLRVGAARVPAEEQDRYRLTKAWNLNLEWPAFSKVCWHLYPDRAVFCGVHFRLDQTVSFRCYLTILNDMRVPR